MEIELKEISVRELTNEYRDEKEDGGVSGFNGKLDIRPPYQREFIYKEHQRVAVINTVSKDFPLNVMYWSARDDGNYEVIDGQQRTISICQFVAGEFSHGDKYFHNLREDEKKQILDYKIMVYLCSGTDSEKLDWFKTINIQGEKLSPQELRNAVYCGSWVSKAKLLFSKTGGPAYEFGNDKHHKGKNLMKGSPIRQEYMETAINWISEGEIEDYMAKHQHDEDASELWQYYQSVINWVASTFPQYRREMKGIAWGELYNTYKDKPLNAVSLESEISGYMEDDDIQKKSGIYHYVLDGKARHLSLRSFLDSQRRVAFEKQNGVCVKCEKRFEINEMEADHITPWSKGGKTVPENLQMLCKDDNRMKSNM